MTVNVNPLDLSTEEPNLEDREARETRPTVEVTRALAEEDRTRGEVRGSSTEEAQSLGPRPGVRRAARRRVVRDVNVHETFARSYPRRRPGRVRFAALTALDTRTMAALAQFAGAAMFVATVLQWAIRPRRAAHFRRTLRACGVGAVLAGAGEWLSADRCAPSAH